MEQEEKLLPVRDYEPTKEAGNKVLEDLFLGEKPGHSEVKVRECGKKRTENVHGFSDVAVTVMLARIILVE